MQTRTKMDQVLAELQDIQRIALRKGFHTFQIGATVWKYEDEGEGDEGLIREYGDTQQMDLRVVIFKTGSDEDEDFASFTIRQTDTAEKIKHTINQIEEIVCS